MARGGERGERHPSAAGLERFLLGEMSSRQAAPIISHLLSGCQQCRAGMTPLASVVFATGPLAPEMAPSSGSEYDFPIFKALASARRYASSLVREAADPSPQIPEKFPNLEVLKSAGEARYEWDRCEALIERCRHLRYSDLEGMILAASLAVTLAERITASQGEGAELADLQARAWAELGNAHRVADNLISAETAINRAVDRSRQGTGDALLLARLMDLTASLYTDQRRFEEARVLLDQVYQIYEHAGDVHAAARTLISKGVSANYSLQPEQAIGFLIAGIRQIDPARDPKLVLVALHGLLWCLVETGRAVEAQALLDGVEGLYQAHGERFDHLKRIWLDARIAAHLGQEKRAEKSFRQVYAGYIGADLAYDAALVSLDLAALWLHQGRTLEIKEIIDEMITVFRARSIQREALGALLMLKKAFETDQATAALLRTVTTEIWRAERSPVRRAGLSN